MESVTPREVTFRNLVEADLPMFHEWLSRPHVAAWWGESGTLADLAADLAPALAGSPSHRAFVVRVDGKDVGFIQWYVATAFHNEGWWRDEHDPGVRGIDQFLADADLLGHGIGTLMVHAFVGWLYYDPAVTRVQTDPSPLNARAVRCYEKAGFRASREVDTPDGRALLMYCERGAFLSVPWWT